MGKTSGSGLFWNAYEDDGGWFVEIFDKECNVLLLSGPHDSQPDTEHIRKMIDEVKKQQRQVNNG